jgi:murein DD-endopeptidase MepM/ murein hydrolase activator NlpD
MPKGLGVLRKWLRVLLLVTLIAASLPIGSASAQATNNTIYIVQAGDTLFGIARRYGVNPVELAVANQIINPDLIFVGQRLKIPGAAPAAPTTQAQPTAQAKPTSTPPVANRIHIVQSGETLYRIALNNNTTVNALVVANNLGDASIILVGQQLIIPAASGSAAAALTQPSTPLPSPFTRIDIGPLPLIQGSVMVVTVRTERPVTLSGTFQNWTIPFAPNGADYIGLVGVGAHPVTGVKPGIYPVSVTATDAKDQQVTVSTNVQIGAGHFNSESIDLPPDRQDLLDPALIASENSKLSATWSVFNPVRYWSGLFNVPVASYMKISSPFGTRRSYGGGPFTSYHEGTDFAIPSGTPVYAPADGVVVLAEQLTVRGNAVVIDHGWGVYSGLYHLKSFVAPVGQKVKQGDLVAYSDNTGLSTGAHLHWDIRIRGLNVDALQFTRSVFP